MSLLNDSRTLRFLAVAWFIAALIPFARGPIGTLLVARAQGYLVFGHLHAAERYIIRARAIDPANTQLAEIDTFAIGMAVHPTKANLRRVDMLVAQHSNDPLTLRNAALIELHARHLKKAIALLERAHRLAPTTTVQAWINLERILKTKVEKKTS